MAQAFEGRAREGERRRGDVELDGARAPDLLCSGATERPAAKRGAPDGDAGYSIDL